MWANHALAFCAVEAIGRDIGGSDHVGAIISHCCKELKRLATVPWEQDAQVTTFLTGFGKFVRDEWHGQECVAAFAECVAAFAVVRNRRNAVNCPGNKIETP